MLILNLFQNKRHLINIKIYIFVFSIAISPCRCSEFTSPKRVCILYLKAWEKGNYEKMYSLLSKRRQKMVGTKTDYMFGFKKFDVKPFYFKIKNVTVKEDWASIRIQLKFPKSIRQTAVPLDLPKEQREKLMQEIDTEFSERMKIIREEDGKWKINEEPEYANTLGVHMKYLKTMFEISLSHPRFRKNEHLHKEFFKKEFRIDEKTYKKLMEEIKGKNSKR